MRRGARGAGILVAARETGRVLLLKRSSEVTEPGVWGVPGGKVDRGESERSAAVRELEEETGYDSSVVVSAEPIFVFEEPDFSFATYMGCVEEEFDPWINWESAAARWCQPGRFPKPLHFGMVELLAHVDLEREVRSVCSLARGLRRMLR
jgi:8-oxo-dGTP pyrophosphatase MutT (NUDIX family)